METTKRIERGDSVAFDEDSTVGLAETTSRFKLGVVIALLVVITAPIVISEYVAYRYREWRRKYRA